MHNDAVAGDVETVAVGRSVTKLAIAMTLLVVLGVTVLVVSVAVVWRGAEKNQLFCFGCGNQATTVRTATQQWASHATTHFGLTLESRMRCGITPKSANPNGQFYPVSCTGSTASGVRVDLTGTHAGIAGNSSQYLSGPWTLTVGAVSHHLRCLPSNWQQRYPCGKHSRP
jgi:hypothetical protein